MERVSVRDGPILNLGFTKYIQIQCKNHFLGITRGIFVEMVPFFLRTLKKCTKKDPLTWWLICNLGDLFSIYIYLLILMSDLAHVWFKLHFGTFSFAWHSFFRVPTIWGRRAFFIYLHLTPIPLNWFEPNLVWWQRVLLWMYRRHYFVERGSLGWRVDIKYLHITARPLDRFG